MLVSVQALGETGSCGGCGQMITVTMRNSHPIAPVVPAEVKSTANGVCIQCARTFRGAWDIHESDVGLICDICARQITARAHAHPKASVETAPGLPAPTQENLEEIRAFLAESSRDELENRAIVMRSVARFTLAFLAAGTFVAAVLTYLATVAPNSIDTLGSGNASFATLLAELFIVNTILYTTSLYCTCWYFDRLPNDNVLANIIAIGSVAVVIGVINMLAVNGFLAIGACLISLGICYVVYDFRIVEFIVLSIISRLIDAALMAPMILLQAAQLIE